MQQFLQINKVGMRFLLHLILCERVNHRECFISEPLKTSENHEVFRCRNETLPQSGLILELSILYVPMYSRMNQVKFCGRQPLKKLR